LYLPITQNEVRKLGWDKLDIVLVTGDTYIDSPYIGVAVIGKLLARHGYRVGIIAQPDVQSGKDISRLGEPRLFWGVSGGSVDSMVANYTATKRKRRSDDYTPGGINNRRPDRAVIAYSNLIRKHFKNTKPIVLGGIEASLRRVAHYDYWSDSIRKSILFDAKADLLIYGMGEKAIVEIAEKLSSDKDTTDITGTCYIAKEKKDGYLDLPSFDRVKSSKQAFAEMFKTFYENNDPHTAKGLCQKQDTRYLVQNPPSPLLTQKELDELYEIGYENEAHPSCRKQGKVKAVDTIRYSITTHRGCYGECNFCSIGVHQGQTVQWRSEKSILNEARRLTELPGFKGNIMDVGGPTANMYGFECEKKLTKGVCRSKRCLYPRICKHLKPDHSIQVPLLKKLRKLPGIKRVFVASGLRHDMVLADRKHGLSYLRELVSHHVSGQMKIAPEHTEERVLSTMGKPPTGSLLTFHELFYKLTGKAKKKQYLTYYLIAAHPGCAESDMYKLKEFISDKLRITPEQVQIFTPLPSTYSALMYYTEHDPFTGKKLFVEKNIKGKQNQKLIVTGKERRSSRSHRKH